VRVTIFLCCEELRPAHDGLTDLLGVGVSHFLVTGFPAKISFAMFARVAADLTDAFGKKTARMRIVAQDKALAEMKWPFEMLHEEYNVNLMFPVIFGATGKGDYRIEFSVDENPEAKGSWPLGIDLGAGKH
jgi:hypothetical protein